MSPNSPTASPTPTEWKTGKTGKACGGNNSPRAPLILLRSFAASAGQGERKDYAGVLGRRCSGGGVSAGVSLRPHLRWPTPVRPAPDSRVKGWDFQMVRGEGSRLKKACRHYREERCFAPILPLAAHNLPVPPCPAEATKPEGRNKGRGGPPDMSGELFLSLQGPEDRGIPSAPDTLYGVRDLHDGHFI